MTNTRPTIKRNQSLELCKLTASVFVVFLHVPFPGEFGGLVSCLSRLAVPLFFAISGWFSFQTEGQKLGKRLKHIVGLELIGIFLYGGYRWIMAWYLGGTLQDCLQAVTFTREKLLRWLILNVDPYAGHLWYLSAAAGCYLVLWLYVRAHRRRPVSYRTLYVLAAVLLAAHFDMAEFSVFSGISVDYRVYRSGLFLGLPMFTLGIFLRECRERGAVPGTGKLMLLLLGGIGLSIAGWRIFGGWELYLGTVLAVMALLLLADRHPLAHRDMTRLGRMSTTIYMLHLLILQVYQMFFQTRAAEALGTAEPWTAPVLVALVSLLAGIAWERICSLVKTVRK